MCKARQGSVLTRINCCLVGTRFSTSRYLTYIQVVLLILEGLENYPLGHLIELTLLEKKLEFYWPFWACEV